MSATPTHDEQRYTQFVSALETLSKEYGVVLSITGGVHIVPVDDDNLKKLKYTNDISSGDIHPV